MTKEKQRIAIAESCPDVATLNEEGDWVWKGYPVRKFFQPLSYLDAIREAVLRLPEDKLRQFATELGRIVYGEYFDEWDRSLWPRLFTATPAQWSEAYLRTIGKWEED